MASDMSTYLGNKVLGWMAGNAMPAAPGTVYAALYDGDPKSTGTEVTDTIRAAGRVAITLSTWATGTTNTMDNSADVDFGNAAGAVANLSHVAIFDAATGGNILFSHALTGGPFSVSAGTSVKFPATNLDWTLGS